MYLAHTPISFGGFQLQVSGWDSVFGPIRSTEIRYLQGQPGTMKTWNYVKAAVADLDFHNHLILAPTKNLSAQHADMLMHEGVHESRVFLVNEDTCSQPSKACMNAILRNCQDGVAICATQQMYAGLPSEFHDLMLDNKRWFRVVDEVPRAVDPIQLFLPKTYEVAQKWLLPLLTFTDSPDHADLVLVAALDRQALKARMDWRERSYLRDDILKIFDPLVAALLDPHNPIIEMERKAVDALMTGKGQRLDALVRYSMKPYGGSLVIGAHVLDSRFDYAARKEGVALRRFNGIRLRDMSAVNEQVSFEYLVDEDDIHASQRLKREKRGDKTFQELADERALNIFGGEPFLQYDNKGANPIAPNAIVVEPVCHGLNRYRQYKNVYVRGAFNPSPSSYRLAEKSLGMKREAMNRDINIENTGQGVGRIGALRDLGVSGGRVLFPLKSTAVGVGSIYGIEPKPASIPLAWKPKKVGRAADPGTMTAGERKALHHARDKAMRVWKARTPFPLAFYGVSVPDQARPPRHLSGSGAPVALRQA